MSTLQQRDIDAVVATSGELSDLPDVATFRATVPFLVARLVPCRLAGWNDIDLVRGEIEVALTDRVELWPGASAELIRHADEHPVYANYRRTGDPQPHAISEFVSEAEFHRTALYNELYRRIGTEDQLGAVIPDPGHQIQLTVDRDRWGFSERDRLVLTLFRTSVVARYDALVHQARMAHLLALREQVAAPDAEGLIIVNAHRRIVDATPAAQAIMARWWSGTRTTLPPDVGAWYASSRSSRSVLAPLRIERKGVGTLVVRRLGAEPGALVLHERAVLPSAVAHRRWGLTDRQGAVMGMVLAGLTNDQIGAGLGISARTVEKHLQLVYGRLGVANRTAAVAAVRQLDGGESVKLVQARLGHASTAETLDT